MKSIQISALISLMNESISTSGRTRNIVVIIEAQRGFIWTRSKISEMIEALPGLCVIDSAVYLSFIKTSPSF